MSAPLIITRRTAGDVVILQLEGRLIFDEAGLQLLREEVSGLVAGGRRHILLDLRGVTHMDSGGVGALAAISLHVVKRKGSLKLLAPSDRVLRVLHITHLESVFEIFAQELDAVRSFPPADDAATVDKRGARPIVSVGDMFSTRHHHRHHHHSCSGGPVSVRFMS